MPNEHVEIEHDEHKAIALANPARVIPTVPLELFYHSLRKLNGKHKEIAVLLDGRHGAAGDSFLAELFRRSVRHAECYSNTEEGFYPKTRRAWGSKDDCFAKNLLTKLHGARTIPVDGGVSSGMRFVDYEIYPFRTTYSCLESGLPATRAGSGGIDLLLASDSEGVLLPAVGEIKASTDLGPTFAVIQALTYASQLATRSQFERLRAHYPEAFGEIEPESPRVDIAIFLEGSPALCRDFEYAMRLADGLCSRLSDRLRGISFLACHIENEAVRCESVGLA